MMKKLHLIGLMCLLGLGFNELWGQTISITNWSTDPTKPRTICQCDTFDLPVNKTPGPGNHKEAIRYFLSGNFNPTTEFAFEFANPVNAFATADSLDILDISIRTAVGPPPTFASDTFSGPAEHYASVVIPCNAPLGPASLRISNSSGVKSDTIYFIVNRIPDPAVIKSVTNAVDNPYTPTVPDLGFCQGDTVVLEAEQQPGANYQWFRNGSAIAGETDTIHKAIIPGTYSLRIDLGACPRMSKDTILNVFPRATLGNLEFVPSPMAFQMDNPIIPNVSPDDSVMFCESVTATLNAPRTPPAGVTFEYQWITDTIDPNSGQPIYFPIDTVSAGKPRMDTSQSLTIDSSLISFVNGEARVYLTIYDGFCNDTSRTIFLFMDSIPATVVRNRTWDKGVLLPINVNSDICMKDDSLILSSSYTASNIKYQWQRSLNGSSWANLPSANNPTVNGTMRTLNVDTSYKPKPTPTITYYRLVTSTVTPFTNDVVCSFTSDSVRIRWLPDYRVEVAPGQPQVTFIAPDTVNFCETDSAIVRGPASPDPFVLPYKYGWLKDTVNALNQTVQIPTGPNDTLRNVTVRKSGKYYVTFDDGICIDTSRAVYVYVDTIPQTNLVSVPFAGIPPKVDPFDRCLYDSVQISVTDTVRPGWDYQWQRFVETVGWIDLVNDTNPAIVVDTSYTPLEDTTLYRVVINYTNRFGIPGCEYISDAVEVRWYDLPQITFFPSDSVGLCFGETVRVVAEGNALSYRWADGPLGASRVFDNVGTYTLIAKGVNDCEKEYEVDIYDITINANAGPDQTINSNQSATLTASGGVTYRWYASEPLDFNDFLSQSIQVSKILPDSVASDTITIYVEATGADGCQDTDSLLLIILNPRNKDNLLNLENAYNLFTPNADGVNDRWDIRRIVDDYGGCDIMVLNRWGSVRYEEENFSGLWDGNDQGGNPLPDGTYYYILSCDDQVILKSAVTIIRNE